MNKKVLNEILEVREQEIKDGKNLATAQPIYIVYDLQECWANAHTEIGGNMNHKDKNSEEGWVDESEDEMEFYKSEDNLKNPREVTRFWIDRYVAIFLTSEAAHDYLKYQKHNMSEGYVYVHHSGYANHQMNSLLEGK